MTPRIMHIAEIGLKVSDLNNMIAFYQEHLGFSILIKEDKHVFMKIADLDSDLGKVNHPQILAFFDRNMDLDISMTTLDHLAFEVADDEYDKERAEFLEKFVANAKASFEEKWGPPQRSATGVLQWNKDGHEWIDEGELHRQAKQALRKELEKTGELEAEWIYEKEVRGNMPTQERYDAILSGAKDSVKGVQETITKLGGLHGAELQRAINAGFIARGGKPPLRVDGDEGGD